MTLRRTLALGLAAALCAGAAGANTILINDPYPADFSVDCPDGCEGLLGSGALSVTEADSFDLPDASEATIAATLSSLVMKTFESSVVQKFDLGGGDDGTDFTFGVTPGYFFTKYAQRTAFFHTDTAQNVTFRKDGTGPGALSNYGTAGVGVIPLPAAGWLMLAGLGGLAAARARRRTA